MAHKMTKRGQLDNIITYEHYCDTRADMANIPPSEINLGSVCIVLQGAVGLEVYMANSNKQWIDITSFGTTDSEDDETSNIVGTGTVGNMTLKG